MNIGIIVFRLLKLSDELDIQTLTPLGGTTLLLEARPPVPPPGLRPCELVISSFNLKL